MTIWVDAQLSPTIAKFIEGEFQISSIHVRDLGLRESNDDTIFAAAKVSNSTVMTKDEDFSILLQRFGPPPKVIWITCGNTSNEHLQLILRRFLPSALALLDEGSELVEIF